VVKRAVALAAIAACCGAACSARLSSRAGDGVRVRALAPYVVTKRITLLDKARIPCDEQRAREFLNLPTGEAYALNVDNRFAWFASNELGVAFYESGALKEVTLNSDPQVDETLEASAKLAKETAGLVTSIAAASVTAAAGDPDPASCGKFRDERIECVELFEAWQATPESCG
jgi:hypothetical protein